MDKSTTSETARSSVLEIPRPTTGPVALLVGTRKGAFILRSDKSRQTWKLSPPVFLGNMVNHIVLDPRDGQTLLMAARTGHLGPTIFRSADFGRTWTEAATPPAFHKATEGEQGLVVDHVFSVVPGHSGEPGVWYAGTSPQGLFRSEDGGNNWEGVDGFNKHPMAPSWTGWGVEPQAPDGNRLMSILIDPRDPNHMYIGMTGGVFESTDQGRNWQPLNQGCLADFLPDDPYPEYGQCVHCLRLHPLMPDRLFQQNHCGIYRMERSEGRWIRIGEKMPKKIGDFGFPIALHPRDPDTAWVFPVDAHNEWSLLSEGGKPAIYMTRNAGKSWKRQDAGLPPGQAWFNVLRLAMSLDNHDPVGIYFGTTNGEVWGSWDEGESWHCLAARLARILSVEVAELSR